MMKSNNDLECGLALVEAHLVTSRRGGFDDCDSESGDPQKVRMDIETLPQAEIVEEKDVSCWAKCVPRTRASKACCLATVLLLVATPCLVCGTGRCGSKDNDVGGGDVGQPVDLFGKTFFALATTELDLSHSLLTGRVPSEIGLLTPLSKLSLFGNELTGTTPSEVTSLTNLIDLSLHENLLTGHLPSEHGLLKGLNFLGSHENMLSGPVPSDLGLLPQLDALSLGSNSHVTGTIPSEMGLLKNLTFLFPSGASGTLPLELLQL